MRLIPLFLLAGLVACGVTEPEEEVEDTNVDDDDDDDDNNDDTDVEDTGGSGGFAPAVVAVQGIFGVIGGAPADVMIPDSTGAMQTLPPTTGVIFAEEAYLSSGDESYACTVLLSSSTQLSQGSWVSGTNAWFGFTMPADASGDASDCISKGWDTATYGDPVELARANAFGVGVAPLSSDATTAISQITDAATKEYYQSYAVGGGWHLGDLASVAQLDGGFTNTAVTIASAVSGNEVLIESNQLVNIEKDQVAPTGSLTDGFYQVSPLTFFGIEALTGASTAPRAVIEIDPDEFDFFWVTRAAMQ